MKNAALKREIREKIIKKYNQTKHFNTMYYFAL